jgi:hypothetical protein
MKSTAQGREIIKKQLREGSFRYVPGQVMKLHGQVRP